MEKPATFWMTQPLRKYASFSGRAPRAEYWYFYLLCVLISAASTLLVRAAPQFTIVDGLISIALLLPQLAVGFRRLHDIDRSGWWIGAPVALIVPAVFAVGYLGDEPFENIASKPMLVVLGVAALALVVYSIVMLVWLCTQGTSGSNRYGPDPLDPDGDLAEVFS